MTAVMLRYGIDRGRHILAREPCDRRPELDDLGDDVDGLGPELHDVRFEVDESRQLQHSRRDGPPCVNVIGY
jgi:hypothetical protein